MGDTPHYDFFVIGAGSGGVRSARIAAGHGAKVGVAEGNPLGGTCVNLGCIPKKLYAYASDFHMEAQDSRGYGWHVQKSMFDWSILKAKKDDEIARLNGIYGRLLENSGVTVHDGFAQFVDDHTIRIGEEFVTADKILIATGGKPSRPSIEGHELILTSDDVFQRDEWPNDITILGGGYIAVEMAHIFHGLGHSVNLIYRGSLFLRGFDDDLRMHLAQEMKTQGINLIFEDNIRKITAVEGDLDGKAGKEVTMDSGKVFITGEVIAAIGRDANTADLALGKAGVEMDDKGNIPVADDYTTNKKHIYAVGDVSSMYQLTPVAIKEGHFLADNLFGPHKDKVAPVYYGNVATAVFSHPPIGTVGLSETDARIKGHKVDIYRSTFKPLKHTISGRDEKTMMKLVVDKDTDIVLGVHMAGVDAPEIIQGMAIALNAGATKAVFDRTMPVHPTACEELVTMREPVTA
jgi:glutathione reductase (NADPH)